MCIEVVEVWFGNSPWQISSTFDSGICPLHDNGGVLSLCPNFEEVGGAYCFRTFVRACVRPSVRPCVRPLRFLMHRITPEPCMLRF